MGGLDLLKTWLARRGAAFTEAARRFGLPEPKGLLLLGVQGCGKSLTAKAIAAQWRLPLLRLDMGRIFSGLVGSSEENLRRAIQVAESVAPVVLWIDEIEKGLSGIQAPRARSDGGVTARVFGTLLTWLQEKTAPVFVVATANRIEQLPPELLRKGRFDEIFFIDLPVARRAPRDLRDPRRGAAGATRRATTSSGSPAPRGVLRRGDRAGGRLGALRRLRRGQGARAGATSTRAVAETLPLSDHHARGDRRGCASGRAPAPAPRPARRPSPCPPPRRGDRRVAPPPLPPHRALPDRPARGGRRAGRGDRRALRDGGAPRRAARRPRAAPAPSSTGSARSRTPRSSSSRPPPGSSRSPAASAAGWTTASSRPSARAAARASTPRRSASSTSGSGQRRQEEAAREAVHEAELRALRSRARRRARVGATGHGRGARARGGRARAAPARRGARRRRRLRLGRGRAPASPAAAGSGRLTPSGTTAPLDLPSPLRDLRAPSVPPERPEEPLCRTRAVTSSRRR